MKIGYLGMGAWGFCLASLLAAKGYELVCWTTNKDLADHLTKTREHPKLPGFQATGKMTFTTELSQCLQGVDVLVESVTSAGLRPVFTEAKKHGIPLCPIVVTSKGIEQGSGLILSDVVIEVLGEQYRPHIGYISGPSFAQEVIRGLPTSVVASAYDYDLMIQICNAFSTPSFRVYPNTDILGVAYGGSLKNIVGIACGVSEGLALGRSAMAALMTRGLHEIRKLAVARGCRAETIYGLAGMGDLFVTCSSAMSRNFRFGLLLAQGHSPKEAYDNIGMVVEGAYTCVSALQVSEKMGIPMPITEAVCKIIYEGMEPKKAVNALMQRTIKEEHL
jgi:glycerol-3-phosphate dehydrogenase (NAD(P)+)